METYRKIDGIPASRCTTSSIYVSSRWAGQAIQPAKAGATAPANAATAASSIAHGIIGTINRFANRPIKDIWPNTIIINGRVIISAHKVSIKTIVSNLGGLENNRPVISGAIIRTPKKARNERYQP